MVEKKLVEAIDQGIKKAEDLLAGLPEPVRKRTIELKAMPDEIITRIKQIDGVIIDFEEKK